MSTAWDWIGEADLTARLDRAYAAMRAMNKLGVDNVSGFLSDARGSTGNAIAELVQFGRRELGEPAVADAPQAGGGGVRRILTGLERAHSSPEAIGRPVPAADRPRLSPYQYGEFLKLLGDVAVAFPEARAPATSLRDLISPAARADYPQLVEFSHQGVE